MAAESLVQRVEDWLREEGCVLEFKTYLSLRQAGVAMPMVGWHARSASGAFREIDVTAVQLEGNCAVRLLCECKYSTDHPWVMLLDDRGKVSALDWQMTARSPGLERRGYLHETERERLEATWHFGRAGSVGYRLMQPRLGMRRQNAKGVERGDQGNKEISSKDRGRDLAYDSLRKIADAAWDYVELPEREAQRGGYYIGLPCLVVEGELFGAWFDAEEERFRVQPIEYGRLRWFGCRGGTMVDVVRYDALQGYATEVRETMELIGAIVGRFEPDIPMVVL